MASPVQLMRRMIETVRRDPAVLALAPDAKNSYRVGRLKDVTATENVLPIIYSDLPNTYIHDRMPIGGVVRPGVSPREIVIYVIHMVCVAAPDAHTRTVQVDAYDLADAVMNSLLANINLTNADGGDPLAHDITVTATNRHMPRAGTQIEGITVMCHVSTTEDHSRSA